MSTLPFDEVHQRTVLGEVSFCLVETVCVDQSVMPYTPPYPIPMREIKPQALPEVATHLQVLDSRSRDLVEEEKKNSRSDGKILLGCLEKIKSKTREGKGGKTYKKT